MDQESNSLLTRTVDKVIVKKTTYTTKELELRVGRSYFAAWPGFDKDKVTEPK